MSSQLPFSRLWQAHKSPTLEQAKALIAQQFPDLEPLQIALLGEGWDNLVFQVNQTLMFRFPRRPQALALLEHESAVLSFLQDRLPIQIPCPRFWGQASGVFDWPFRGYTMLAGKTACRAELSEPERIMLAPQLAKALKFLHAIPVSELKPLNVPADQLQRMDVIYRRKLIAEHMQALLEQNLIAKNQELKINLFLAGLPDVYSARRPLALCHGDLYARHLIVNAEKNLVGLIDWGDVHRGDPAVDLAIVYSFLPAEAHANFWRVYGQVSEETLTLARFRALYHSLSLLRYAQNIQDYALLSEASWALTRILVL